MKELGCQIVTQKKGSEAGKTSQNDNANRGRMMHLSPHVLRPFLIPQTATFCIAMDAKRNSSFAAKIKKGVRNMRSTFNILFYVNKSGDD